MSKGKYQPFSVRQGYEQPKPIQLEGMDDDLRSGLWNVFDRCFPLDESDGFSMPLNVMYENIWTGFLKDPVDKYENFLHGESYNEIKNIFLQNLWYKVFNLIEFVIRCLSVHEEHSLEKPFIKQCNMVLEEEHTG